MAEKQNIRVAIQGITASFHEMAALQYFKDQTVETVECLTFHELCEKLKHDDADFAVMAIENSIAGSLLPNYFLLQDYHFTIVGELYIPIHMNLLALPGTKLSDIKVIESHPMAIRQCSDFIHSLKGVEVRESDDTALSAKRVQELQLKNTAAIANELAAKRFGLEVLERRIETHKKNFTRFLILRRRTNGKVDSNKASLSFEVSNEVGSLAEALMTYKKNGINLSKIQSIPIVGRPNEYSIHIDVEWENRNDYDNAMKEVLIQVKNLNVLGEYKKAKIEYR